MPQVKEGYSLTHAYKFFKKKYKGKYDITLRQYRDICFTFNKLVAKDMLDGKIINLPFCLGKIFIFKYETNWNNPPIDFKATKEQKKVVYFLNRHSEGWGAKFKWNKQIRNIPNLLYYSFKATYTINRQLGQIMLQKDGHKKYMLK